MITCAKCGAFISHDWSNLQTLCSDCGGSGEAIDSGRMIGEQIADRIARFVGYKQGLLAMPRERRQAYLDEASKIIAIVDKEAT